MIAVSFAVSDESRDFAREVHRAALPVRILHTGMGRESTLQRGKAFLDSGPLPAFFISSGFAGGLDPALKVGDIVIGTNFSEASLVAKLPPGSHQGPLSTQAAVVETGAAKHALFRQSGAIAVDMETAHLHAECAARGIPLLSIRVISDTATQSMPVPQEVWFDSVAQKPRIASLLFWLATHPAAIRPFVQFVQGITLARKELTRYLLEALRSLAN
ncbi:MAG: hypothetical protein QM796_13690 [Chthoniobacteraceae bacterium]